MNLRRLLTRTRLLLLAALCGGPLFARAEPAEPLPVVASFSILGEWVTTLGGDDVRVTTLVGPDGDAHVFEPTPADARAVTAAALVFEIGLGFEVWMDGLLAAAGAEARRRQVSGALTPRKIETPHGAEVDPHVWQDPQNALRMCDAIAAALVAARPAARERVEARRLALAARLEALDRHLREQLAAVPAARRTLVTTHDALGYFGARYGFDIQLSLLASLSTDTSEVSAARVAEVVRALRAKGVPAVFAENFENDSLLRRVAAEAGVRLAGPLYTDSLGPAGSPGATYEGMMRHNAGLLARELSR